MYSTLETEFVTAYLITMYETDKGTGCVGELATAKAPQTVQKHYD
jgi:hypothetical protein